MPVGATSHDGRKSPAVVFFWRACRFALVAALLWYATKDVEWAQVKQDLQDASWRWIGMACLLVVADRFVMAWRWIRLLRAVHPTPGLPLGTTLRVFFVSSFAGAFRPGGIGGDALRTFAVTREGVSTANAVASVAVDRLLGTVSVIWMGAFGLWFVGQLIDARLFGAAAAAAVAAGLVSYGFLIDSRLFRWLLSSLGLTRLPTVNRLTLKFLTAVGQYGQHRRLLTGVLALSVGVQVLRTLQTWCLGLALGVSISGAWYFATVPIIVIVVLLPISVGGVGTVNAAFVALLSIAGVPAEQAFTLSVLFLALSTLGNLPGGLLLATGTPRLEAPRAG
jgi:uncharacterized protein (TIRG00374 family)